MPRPFQFRLRTIFWLVALVAVACVVGPPAVKKYREHRVPLLFKIPVISTLTPVRATP